MSTHEPRISVVIPALNEREAIRHALESTRGAGIERIVVDGGSRDGTPEAARRLGAERVIGSVPGRAVQIATGVAAARGPVLVVLHADSRLEPGWDEAVCAALRAPGVAGGALRLRFDSPRPVYRWIEWGVRLRCLLARLPYGDQALFVRRELLERAGGLPGTPIFEDLDLVRVIRRGGRLALLRSEVRTSPRRYERHGVLATIARNNLALVAYLLRLDRSRVARWYRRSFAA